MKINLHCDRASIHETSVRNLVLLYYPCETFSADKNASEEGDTLTVVLKRLDDGTLYAECLLESHMGSACAVEYERELNGTLPCFSIEKLLVGRAFVKCASKIFGYIPPFGILAGVRPAKLILPYMEKGSDYHIGEYELNRLLIESCMVSENKAKLMQQIANKEMQVSASLPEKSASLYVSIPFCPTRCRYCSFVSYSTDRLLAMIPDYIDRLILEMRALGDIVKDLEIPIKSVYVGGGTPSILTPMQSERVLESVYESFDLSSINEFTYEAGRPDTVTKEKLDILKKYNVDRVSINTQSTNDEVLMSVGRNHTFGQYLNALELARNAGFSTINTDLIAGLPGESAQSFMNSVDEIIRLAPENITVHSFSLKRSSEFKVSGKKSFDDATEARALLDYSQRALQENAYDPYYIYRQKNTLGNLENVGYSKAGHECLYNICMMEELHTVFSVGAGAVTKLVSRDKNRIERIFNHKYPYEYLSDENYIPKREVFTDFYNNF